MGGQQQSTRMSGEAISLIIEGAARRGNKEASAYNCRIMQKMLAGFALILAFLLARAYAQPDKTQQPTKVNQPAVSVVPVQPKPASSPSAQPDLQKHVQDDVWVMKIPDKDGWDKAAFGVSVALLLVAVFGVVYAKQTLNAIEGQLQEIKAAGLQTDKMIANAGKHADAAINAARPFVMVEATRNGDFIEFRAVNYGKSPARITYYNPVTSARAVPIGEELPENPFYGIHYDNDDALILNVQWLAPGKDMQVGSYYLEAIREGNPEHWADMEGGRRRLYLYSAVKYRGILEDKVYRSTFCYMAINGGLMMSGPYGYNEYT
jgi:hypothetical protein